MHTWAFYHKEGEFLGLAYIMLPTLSVLQVREQLKKEGFDVGKLVIYLMERR